eukprot:tig00001126_g7128.t1
MSVKYTELYPLAAAVGVGLGFGLWTGSQKLLRANDVVPTRNRTLAFFKGDEYGGIGPESDIFKTRGVIPGKAGLRVGDPRPEDFPDPVTAKVQRGVELESDTPVAVSHKLK